MHGLFVAVCLLGALLPATFALPSENLVYATPLLNKRSRSSPPSPLVRRNWAQCYHDDDCGKQLVHGQRKCLSGTCQTICNPGWRAVGAKCKPAITCPVGLIPFGTFCLSGPLTPITNKRCASSLTCPTTMPNAFGICDAKYSKCSVVCMSGFLWNGSACVQNTASSAQCSADSQCSPGPSSSGLIGKCQNGCCTTTCADGFTPQNGVCVPYQQDSCANKTCLPISGGSSSCSNGQCNYSCFAAGATPVCNGSSCQCINSGSDPRNCGERHLVCPTPPLAYQLGDQALPCCINGQCTLGCASGSPVFYSPLGQAYCPRRRAVRQRAL